MNLDKIGRTNNPLIINAKTWKKWHDEKRVFVLEKATSDTPEILSVELFPGKQSVRMTCKESAGRFYLYRDV